MKLIYVGLAALFLLVIPTSATIYEDQYIKFEYPDSWAFESNSVGSYHIVDGPPGAWDGPGIPDYGSGSELYIQLDLGKSYCNIVLPREDDYDMGEVLEAMAGILTSIEIK